MGAAKRRKTAGTYSTQPAKPIVQLYPLILARPEPKDYRPPPGNIGIVVDEPDQPLVALHILAEMVPAVVKIFVDAAKREGRKNIEGMFWTALHDWHKDPKHPPAGAKAPTDMSADEAYGFALSAAFWLAFADPPDNPGRAEIMRIGCDMQMKEYGAACVTLGVLLRPHHGSFGTSPRTRRWCMNHGGPPTYFNPNTALGRNESMH